MQGHDIDTTSPPLSYLRKKKPLILIMQTEQGQLSSSCHKQPQTGQSLNLSPGNFHQMRKLLIYPPRTETVVQFKEKVKKNMI